MVVGTEGLAPYTEGTFVPDNFVSQPTNNLTGDYLMNRFITLCAGASALAMLAILLSWIFSPSTPTVSLSAKEWMCVESAPSGLNSICTMYTRVPTKTVKQ